MLSALGSSHHSDTDVRHMCLNFLQFQNMEPHHLCLFTVVYFNTKPSLGYFDYQELYFSIEINSIVKYNFRVLFWKFESTDFYLQAPLSPTSFNFEVFNFTLKSPSPHKFEVSSCDNIKKSSNIQG